MSVVITSTTSSQKDMDHAVSDNWREAPVEAPEPTPEPVPAKEPETEVPSEPEAPEVETKSDAEPVDTDKPKPKEHKSGWQRRVDKLVARNHQLETRIAEFEAAKAAAAKPEEAAAKAPQLPAEPKLADFDGDVEKFVAARDQWKEAAEMQKTRAEQHKVIVDEYNEKVSKARGEYEDWDEVVSGSKIIIPQPAIDAIIELDNGPDVAYYLAQHPDVAQVLMDMTPIRAIQYVAKISDQVAAERTPAPPKPKAKVPEPIKPVGSSATRHSTMEEIPIRDYIRIRNKQEREARRG